MIVNGFVKVISALEKFLYFISMFLRVNNLIIDNSGILEQY